MIFLAGISFTSRCLVHPPSVIADGFIPSKLKILLILLILSKYKTSFNHTPQTHQQTALCDTSELAHAACLVE